MRTSLASAALTLVVALALGACARDADGGGAADPEAPLRVGALAVPAGDMLRFVDEELAPDAGIDLEFVEFSDYNTPNAALADGDVDANLFQNTTFLETFNEANDEDLVSLGPVYLPPMALYSEDLGSVEEIPDGASIAVPNDPTNEGRALKLLAEHGLIEVTEEPVTVADVTDNPKGLEFTELENASLPQAVADQDAAIVTAAFALPAGLTVDQQIFAEGTDSDYYNVLATTPELAEDARVKKLFTLLTSEEMRAWIEEEYQGIIVPAS
ncbi:MetQ/NlpA family ABC transporter substrate-binding protein [Georgenia sp. TF02-10]|uniref:MetQ/NlpA family ABC transporter substrate-binding protein n=1 Tax=Georgenia sp. TF02-10 TaxID=2917725 RepID=UPI001FA6C235|nr:MetQ/NlpA family ABC transporter substrate-binding protein [Georgenia sp. TF02-10]UNX54754.1 MetQ/NlpA family ABC transporter substrate-binding protein [Georgenia sp. TF02-10]